MVVIEEHEESDHEVNDAGSDNENAGKQPAADSDEEDAGAKKGKGPDVEKLLADGKKQKEIGFGAFRMQKYEKAIECWSMARGTMKHILDKEFFKGNEEKIAEVRELETTLHLNLSQAYLNNKEFYQAIKFCDKVLEKNPSNVKALYRKASAHIMGSAYPEAKLAIDALLKIEPDNSAAKQLLVDISRKEELSKKSGKKAAKKMFDAFNENHDPRIREEEPPTMLEQIPGWFSCAWCQRRKHD